jgi:hypothetical protein
MGGGVVEFHEGSMGRVAGPVNRISRIIEITNARLLLIGGPVIDRDRMAVCLLTGRGGDASGIHDSLSALQS